MGLSQKIGSRFGRATGLWQCHYTVQKRLQLEGVGMPDQVAVFLIQFGECLQPVGADEDNWRDGVLTIASPSPLEAVLWGNAEFEMVAIRRYHSSL